MIRVYPATKLDNIDTISMLKRKWERIVFFHARWPHYVEVGIPDSAKHAEQFWVEDQQDIISADALMVFGEPEQHLRGALVEVGMALAHAKPVVAVGTHRDFGTWQYHPGVIRVANFEIAEAYFSMLNNHQLEAIRKARHEFENPHP